MRRVYFIIISYNNLPPFFDVSLYVFRAFQQQPGGLFTYFTSTKLFTKYFGKWIFPLCQAMPTTPLSFDRGSKKDIGEKTVKWFESDFTFKICHLTLLSHPSESVWLSFRWNHYLKELNFQKTFSRKEQQQIRKKNYRHNTNNLLNTKANILSQPAS